MNLTDQIESCDDDGRDILKIAACVSDISTFKFILLNIEKIVETPNIMKDFFTSYDSKNKNLLQLAVIENKSIDFHIFLWKKVEEYFNHSDICDLINFVDESGKTMLQYAKEQNSTHIHKFLANEVLKLNMSNLPSNLHSVEAYNEVIEEEEEEMEDEGERDCDYWLMEARRGNYGNLWFNNIIRKGPK